MLSELTCIVYSNASGFIFFGQRNVEHVEK